MNCEIKDNYLCLPIGTKLYFNQTGLVHKQIRLINKNHNEIYAIFDENDVEFEICCDNREFDRGIAITLTINRINQSFYIRPNKLSTFKALQTNGQKLHFITENTGDGHVFVVPTAHRDGISYELASIYCSKIMFDIDVEQCKNKTIDLPFNAIDISLIGTTIKLSVQTLIKTIVIDIGLNNTIRDLKMIIAKREGIPPKQQRLILNGKLLEDHKSIADYNIEIHCTLQLDPKLMGAWLPPTLYEITDDTMHSVNDKTDSNANRSSSQYNKEKDIKASQSFIKRGVKCLGVISDEKFTSYKGFRIDPNIRVKSFVVEMQIESI